MFQKYTDKLPVYKILYRYTWQHTDISASWNGLLTAHHNYNDSYQNLNIFSAREDLGVHWYLGILQGKVVSHALFYKYVKLR